MNTLKFTEHLLALSPNERRAFLQQHRAEIDVPLSAALQARTDEVARRDLAAATQVAEIAAEVSEYGAGAVGRAYAAWARGVVSFYQGKFAACLTDYEQAQQIFAARDYPVEAARIQASAVFALTNLGEYEQALHAAHAARPELLQAEAWNILARLEANLGVTYEHLSRYAEADAAYRRAHELFSQEGETLMAARVAVNRAVLLEKRDHYREATALLLAVREVFAAQDQALPLARTNLNLGLLQARQGHYHEALRALAAARRGFAALDVAVEGATVDFERAHVYLRLNLLPEVIELCQQARQVFAAYALPRYVALSDWYAALAYARLAEYAPAAAHFGAARQVLGAQGERLLMARLDLDYAALEYAQITPHPNPLPTREREHASLSLTESSSTIRLRAGNVGEGSYTRVLSIVAEVLEIFTAHGLAVQATRARLLAADCHRALAQAGQAQPLYRQVLTTATELGLAELSYRAAYGLGLLARAAGDLPAAYHFLTQAVAEIGHLQERLRGDELRAGLRADKQEVYAALVKLCLALHKPEEAFAVVEQSRSPVAGETLTAAWRAPTAAADPHRAELLARLRELKEQWHWQQSKEARHIPLAEEYRGAPVPAQVHVTEREIAEVVRSLQLLAAPGAPAPRAVAEVQQRLPARTALVMYYIVDDAVLAFVVTAQDMQVWDDLAPAAPVREYLDMVRFSVRDALFEAERELTEVQELLRQLYEWLFAKLADKLRGYTRLWIVPHGALYYLPFHALYDGARYLVERFEVAYLPSAGASTTGMKPATTGDALVMGYSAAGRLPHTVTEARRVRDSLDMPHCHFFTEAEATVARWQEFAGRSRLVHLATHGIFREDNPLFSALQLADNQVTVYDLYTLTLPRGAVVVLSGCETGLGGHRGGDLLGLSRGFLHAGAGAVVVSLWAVPDTATAELMARFYAELPQTRRVSQALRAAQVALLARYPHPFFWGAFMVIGRGGE